MPIVTEEMILQDYLKIDKKDFFHTYEGSYYPNNNQ